MKRNIRTLAVLLAVFAPSLGRAALSAEKLQSVIGGRDNSLSTLIYQSKEDADLRQQTLAGTFDAYKAEAEKLIASKNELLEEQTKQLKELSKTAGGVETFKKALKEAAEATQHLNNEMLEETKILTKVNLGERIKANDDKLTIIDEKLFELNELNEKGGADATTLTEEIKKLNEKKVRINKESEELRSQKASLEEELKKPAGKEEDEAKK